MRRGENVWVRRAGLLTVAALAFLANLGFFLWYRGTAQDRQKGLERRKAALTREVAVAEDEATRLSLQRDRLRKASAAVSDFYSRRIGSRREALAPMVEEIHDVLERVGIHPSQISYATTSLTDLPLSQMTVSFSFRNDYARFKQLLSAFESDRKWIVVREVGLSRDPEVPGGVQVHLQLATYFTGPESPTGRAALAVPTGVRE